MSRKRFLKNSDSEKTPADKDSRFEFADEAMSQGGYAGDNDAETTLPLEKAKPVEKENRKPTSWSATGEERELITDIRRKLISNGVEVSKSDVIALALRAFDEMTFEEQKEVVERFGPDRRRR